MSDQVQGFSMSPQQRHLWRGQRKSNSFMLKALIDVAGPLDRGRFERAVQRVPVLHEIMRTSFQKVPGMPFPLQVVDENPHTLHHHELKDAAAVNALFDKTQGAPEDYGQSPLAQLHLIRTGENKHTLMVHAPTLVLDHGSLKHLVAELGRAYAADDDDTFLDEEIMQYIDISEWLNETLTDEDSEEGLDVWRNLDLSAIDAVKLNLEAQQHREQPYTHQLTPIPLSAETSARLHQLAEAENQTPQVLLSALFLTLLYRHTGKEDLVLGVNVDGRNVEGLEEAIGLLDRVAPLKTTLHGDLSSRQLINQVAEALETTAHFQEYFNWSRHEADYVQHPEPWFFAYTVDYQEVFSNLQIGDLCFNETRLDYRAEPAKLSLSALASGGFLSLNLVSDPNYYTPESVAVLADQLAALLDQMTQKPDAPIAALNLLTQAAHDRQVIEWNDTDTPVGRNKLIHQLFEEIAAQNPENPAVILTERDQANALTAKSLLPNTLTFDQLRRMSNQWARHLHAQGVRPEDRIGVMVNSSVERQVVLLALFKCGGVSVPLDPTYPVERLRYIAEDARVTRVITRKGISVPGLDLPGEAFEEAWPQVKQLPDSNPEFNILDDHLAYIIYTSGSTGKPKGVQLPHRGIVNLALHYADSMKLTGESRLLQAALLNFDASIWELVMPWTKGAATVIPTREQLLPGEPLQHLITAYGITHANLPPAALAVTRPDGCDTLKHLNVAGETCKFDVYQRWAEGRQMYNGYGPSEATVSATVYPCQDEIDALPIGGPMPNIQLYILGSQLNVLPIGMEGELVIGGMGLARGYMGRPAQTALKFVPNPFSQSAGARLYRSGDRAHYRGDGVMMFLGRVDQQVKLRGFRIELGEIEELLADYDGVADAAVVVAERMRNSVMEQRLTAFVAPQVGRENDVSVDTLLNHLRDRLPAYMVPATLIILDTLPVTPNGKVDRLLLASPQLSEKVERRYVAPRNELEWAVAEIWEAVLNESPIGVNDNFFEIGGHSLLAAQVITRIRETFNVELSIRHIFDHPTLPDLAEFVAAKQKEGDVVISGELQEEEEEIAL